MKTPSISAICLGLWLSIPATVTAQPAPSSPVVARHGQRAGLPNFAGAHPLGGIAWEPPSSKFAQGTLLLAYTQKNLGAAIVEWDIDKAAVVRRVSPGKSGLSDVRIARLGAGVFAVTSQEKQPVRWAALSSTLKVERQGSLGMGVGAVVAATEANTFVAWLLPGGTTLAVVRLDPKNGKVTARREIAFSEKVTRGSGEASCDLLLSENRLYLTLETPSRARLVSLSLDLQDMVQADSPGLRGVLFQEQGPMLAIPRPSRVDVFPLNARLVLPQDARQLKWLSSSTRLQATFDATRGLALSDGQVFAPGGQERRALVPPFADIHQAFWGHGRLFLMATDDKADGGYLLWAE